MEEYDYEQTEKHKLLNEYEAEYEAALQREKMKKYIIWAAIAFGALVLFMVIYSLGRDTGTPEGASSLIASTQVSSEVCTAEVVPVRVLSRTNETDVVGNKFCKIMFDNDTYVLTWGTCQESNAFAVGSEAQQTICK